MNSVNIIGAGLAGCEAAWTLANAGISVSLHEMKPKRYSPAHSLESFAELVCSNSLKAERQGSPAGLLKAEMQKLGSVLIECAYQTKVSAGGALAVDRLLFSQAVTEKISNHPLITVNTEEITQIPQGEVIIATGPLTSDAMALSISEICGNNYLSFYDAAAPIVSLDSIDKDSVFFAARYGRGEADYINCPFNKEQYEEFHAALIKAETAKLEEFDKNPIRVYEGCMPVEILAKRGIETLRFGPLKPVGLTDPKTEKRPWAVVQLRSENSENSMYNLVGFQTNLKFPEQKRVFSMIPGLKNAEFLRYGVMHRNTFLDSPRLLDIDFSLRLHKRISFAGQITGVEGYMESAASGILAAIGILRRRAGKTPLILPKDTMLGALSAYICDESVVKFQPMGANMGLLPPLAERVKEKQIRYEKIAERALLSLESAIKREDLN